VRTSFELLVKRWVMSSTAQVGLVERREGGGDVPEQGRVPLSPSSTGMMGAMVRPTG
jgi:hypothetical protein